MVDELNLNPIYPGGTQLQSFVVPFAPETISKAIVTYVQEGAGIVLEKTVSAFSPTEEEGEATFSYRLTQAESLLFRNFLSCKMQVNILMIDGTREPSEPWVVECGDQLHRTVIA